jgi:hypothetical protein
MKKILLFVLALIAAESVVLEAQNSITAQVDLCLDAERFIKNVAGMVSLTEPDTINDWRTQSLTPGCRVTASAATKQLSRNVVRDFFDLLRSDAWIRTPDPRDAPNEASLRFRKSQADCLFSFYDSSVSLNTDAELTVSDAVFKTVGEKLYYFLVLCTPAAPAAPRG